MDLTKAESLIPADHKDCPGILRDEMTKRGCEVTVSLAAPLVAGTYTTTPFICPHGTRYWLEPTGEQIAQWARDGVSR